MTESTLDKRIEELTEAYEGCFELAARLMPEELGAKTKDLWMIPKQRYVAKEEMDQESGREANPEHWQLFLDRVTERIITQLRVAASEGVAVAVLDEPADFPIGGVGAEGGMERIAKKLREMGLKVIIARTSRHRGVPSDFYDDVFDGGAGDISDLQLRVYLPTWENPSWKLWAR